MEGSGILSLVFARQGEVYWDGSPLDWKVSPFSARFDRKRTWMSFYLPWGAEIELFDGFGKHRLLISGECQSLHFRSARAEGNVVCLDAPEDAQDTEMEEEDVS